MARLEPTVCRLIRPEWALRVPSPAHDSLDPLARRRHVAANPHSFLTVTRGPEDLEPGQAWNSARAVAESHASLERLLELGAFSDLADPALYLYGLGVGGPAAGTGPVNHRQASHRQVGIVGNIAVDDYEQGVIRVHEQVHEVRARHLADHLGGLQVQSSPIALAHRADPGLSALVEHIAASSAPVLDFVSPDGLHQQIWRVSDPDAVSRLRAALADAPLYLIDGHHRAAAAAHHRRHLPASSGADRSGTGRRSDPTRPADWMLGVVFAADELRIDAFHRVLHGIDPGRLVDQIGAAFPVRSDVDPGAVVDRRHEEVALLTGTTWHLVDLGPLDGDNTSGRLDTGRLDTGRLDTGRLDTVRLENRVLRPLLDLDTTAPGDRLSYRVGNPGREELAAWRTGPDEALWLMRPVVMEMVLDAADAGVVMPPKSTFFQPKARSGVFLRPHA